MGFESCHADDLVADHDYLGYVPPLLGLNLQLFHQLVPTRAIIDFGLGRRSTGVTVDSLGIIGWTPSLLRWHSRRGSGFGVRDTTRYSWREEG